MAMDKQHIMDEIDRTARDNGGKPLGVRRFKTVTGIKETDWKGIHWTTWNDAVIETGYTPNKKQAPHSQEKLIRDFIFIIRNCHESPKWPTVAEIALTARKNPGLASEKTFRKFRKAHPAATILNYCRERDGYEDVISVCEPIAGAEESDKQSDEEETTPKPLTFGFVYLMKSATFYKIGHSNSPGRRQYELESHRPEGIETVHTIKTDDPEGIEDYWHNRFSQKRKRGEWFDLTREDVQAFKRRNTM